MKDVFGILVSFAIDCLGERLFMTPTPSYISRSIPEALGMTGIEERGVRVARRGDWRCKP